MINIKNLDIRTILIVVLSLVVLGMSMFGTGGGSVLKQIISERESENKVLMGQIKDRNKLIEFQNDTISYYHKLDLRKDQKIDSLEKIRVEQEKDIALLKGKFKEIPGQVKNATDEVRIQWWKDYFKTIETKK